MPRNPWTEHRIFLCRKHSGFLRPTELHVPHQPNFAAYSCAPPAKPHIPLRNNSLRVPNRPPHLRSAAPRWYRRNHRVAYGQLRRTARFLGQTHTDQVYLPFSGTGNSARAFARPYAATSLSASAVVVARRFAAHASRSDLR